MNVVLSLIVSAMSLGSYEPSWESLDQRENPDWFQDAKFGIFIHWGVYAVPAWGPKDRYSEWYWYDMENKNSETWRFHEATYGSDFKYQSFAPLWKTEMFDPEHWADIFARSGAKYVVLTSKHHEGFALWPSAESWNWNSVDIGPHRDICGELTEAVRARNLRMGFYYSFYEWFNPLYRSDVDRYVDQHMLPQLKDLVERYQPDLVWPDGEWEHPSSTWRSVEFLSWLFNESSAPKDVVINDRWGRETRNIHGGFATPEYGHIPEGRLIDAGRWEECQGMGKSFGYNRNEHIDNYRNVTELVHLLIDTVSRGGNLLLDIGPKADGRIPTIMEHLLLEIGKWLDVNGEAIYGTSRGDMPAQEGLRFTRNDDSVFAISLVWPGENLDIVLPDDMTVNGVRLLGLDSTVSFTQSGNTLQIKTPSISPLDNLAPQAYVFELKL